MRVPGTRGKFVDYTCVLADVRLPRTRHSGRTLDCDQDHSSTSWRAPI